MQRTDVTQTDRPGPTVTAPNLIVYTQDHIAAQVAHSTISEVNYRKPAWSFTGAINLCALTCPSTLRTPFFLSFVHWIAKHTALILILCYFNFHRAAVKNIAQPQSWNTVMMDRNQSMIGSDSCKLQEFYISWCMKQSMLGLNLGPAPL